MSSFSATVEPPTKSGAASSRIRQQILFVLKLLVSFGLLAAIILREDPGQLWDRLTHQNPLYAAAALVLLILQYPLAAWRWHLVLRGLGANSRIRDLTRLFWIGQFISQITPSFVAGDGARLWYARREGFPMRATLSGLLWDRAIGFVGLALIVLVMTLQVVELVDDRTTVLAIRYAALALVLGFAGAILLGAVVGERLKLRGLWAARLVDLFADGWNLARRGREFVFILSAAVVANVLTALAAWLLANGSGVPVHLQDVMALVPVALFATLLPISFAGWGVREVSLTYMLAFIGIGTADAVSVSVLLGGCMMIATLPGAYFIMKGNSGVPLREPDPDAPELTPTMAESQR